MTQKPSTKNMRIVETDIETTMLIAECDAIEEVIDRFGDLVDKAIQDYDVPTARRALVLFTVGLCEEFDNDHPGARKALDLFIEQLREAASGFTAEEVAAVAFSGSRT